MWYLRQTNSVESFPGKDRVHYRAGKDPETQLRDSNLLVKRYHFTPDSATSLENKMPKRLLPQSPIACYEKQPTQRRQTQSKRKDAAPALLSATALCHYCMPQCITQFQEVEQLVASNSYRQASQHPQLCPSSQSSSSQSLQSDHSPQTPKRPARQLGIQPTSHSEEMPWHVVAAEGKPQFHPAAHA